MEKMVIESQSSEKRVCGCIINTSPEVTPPRGFSVQKVLARKSWILSRFEHWEVVSALSWLSALSSL